MNLLTFPTQTNQSNETVNYVWSDFTRLGKANVTGMLEERGIKFEPKDNYFKLCSLLYQDYKGSVIPSPTIDLAQKRLKKAEQTIKQARSTEEYLIAVGDKAILELENLRIQKLEKKNS